MHFQILARDSEAGNFNPHLLRVFARRPIRGGMVTERPEQKSMAESNAAMASCATLGGRHQQDTQIYAKIAEGFRRMGDGAGHEWERDASPWCRGGVQRRSERRVERVERVER